MQEFTLGPLSRNRSVPGGHLVLTRSQLVGLDETWPTSPPEGCYMPNIRPSPLVLLLNHEVDAHLPSLGGWVGLVAIQGG